MIGNLMFNMVRETIDHGLLNSWERGPYISDVGMVPIAFDTAPRPSAAELAAGATPGFVPDASGKGSVFGRYRTLAHNFLMGTYNVNSVRTRGPPVGVAPAAAPPAGSNPIRDFCDFCWVVYGGT